jgi:hypothetical protein
MTGNQATCGRFFSYQNGCSKENVTVIHLLSLIKLSLNTIGTLKYSQFLLYMPVN